VDSLPDALDDVHGWDSTADRSAPMLRVDGGRIVDAHRRSPWFEYAGYVN